MSDDVSTARKKYVRSMVGTWRSNLGGNDLTGMILTFRDDGTGALKEWGFDHFYLDPTYVSVPEFRWRSVADYTIEITYCGTTRQVIYDFMIRQDQYGVSELRVFEVGRKPDEYGDLGFWLSPYSLVYRGGDSSSSAAVSRPPAASESAPVTNRPWWRFWI